MRMSRQRCSKRNKIIAFRPWILGLVLFLWAAPAFAQTFPPLSGRVVDAAGILSPELEAQLTSKLAQLETQTTRQMVVATVPDLQGYDIAEYGYRLGDHWAIGQKGENNGLILIVAPNERKVRIEVGPGLEATVPDVLASRIIRNAIVPKFKTGDYPGGIVAGTDAVIDLIKLPPGEAVQQAKQIQAQRSPSNDGADLGTVIFWLFIFFFVILPVISPLLFGRGKRGRRYGAGPVIIWGGGSDWGSGGSGWGSGGGFGGGGGFSGGGGSFGGGGASGGW
jgi:uncharacterized protein